MDVLIVRYGELALKGRNRSYFEKILERNLRIACGNFRVKRIRGRILLKVPDAANNGLDHCMDAVSRVFGVISLSPAAEAEADPERIWEVIRRSFLPSDGPFRVSVHRSDKSFSLSSMELERLIGSRIQQETGLQVSLKGFRSEVSVEIVNNQAYVFSRTERGPGGLPLGTQGSVIALMADEDDVLAAILLMRRGCRIVPFVFSGLSGSAEKSFGRYSIGNQIGSVNINMDRIQDTGADKEVGALIGARKEVAVCTGARDLDGLEEVRKLGKGKLVLSPLFGLDEAAYGNMRCYLS